MEKTPQSGTGPFWVKACLLIVACLISAGIGGGISRNWGASEYTISYSDFVSIMLTAISLLMTVLAIFLAVLGFIGWTSIEQRVHEKAEAYLATLDGAIMKKAEEAIRERTGAIMYEGVTPIDEEDGGDPNDEPEQA
jgi:hypothetical protein